MPQSFWVYILASQTRVLYTGMTNDLSRRLAEHRSGRGSSFVRRYRATRLVYVEEHRTAGDAIRREKQIKAWRREKRVRLIKDANPEWRDLAGDS